MSDEKPVPETPDTIAERITALSTSMHAGFAQVDGRFAQVDARFAQVDARFAQVDGRFAQVDARFAQVDGQFTTLDKSIDKRFDEVSEAFVEQRKYTEFAFGQLRTELNAGFSRLDRKLDRVLITLTRTLAPRRRRRS